MEWHVTVGNDLFSTPLWPLATAGICAAIELVILVISAFFPRAPLDAEPPRAGHGPRARLLWVGIGTFLALLIVMLAPAGAALLGVLTLGPFKGALESARIFQPLILGETIVSCLATILAGGVLAIYQLRNRQSSTDVQSGLLVAALCAWAVSLLGAGAASGIAGLGPLPEFEDPGSFRVHVGKSLELSPRLAGVEDPSAWAVQSVSFLAREPGTFTLSAAASRGLVRVARSFQVEVGKDQGEALFPLETGNRWQYRNVQDYRNQLLWFIPDRGHFEGPIFEVEVGARSTEGPLDSTAIVIRNDSSTSEVIRVFQWNGSLRLVDSPESLFFERIRGVESASKGPDGGALVPCRAAFFPESTCDCLLGPQKKAKLPGPVLCHQEPKKRSGLRALGTGILAVMTAGLVILDPDPDSRWVLVQSGKDLDQEKAPEKAPEKTPKKAKTSGGRGTRRGPG